MQVLARWDEMSKNMALGYWYPRAWIQVGLGDKATALDCLEKGFAEHDSWVVYLKVDPILAPLRDEPRYRALLKKMGLDR